MNTKTPVAEPKSIEEAIFLMRGERVILGAYLTHLYSVETRAKVQNVQRNLPYFPSDFMFQLTDSEFADLRSQFLISSELVTTVSIPAQ